MVERPSRERQAQSWPAACYVVTPIYKAEDATVAAKLNKRAFEYAKERIVEGRVVLDDRDAWSEHQPTAERENEFIRRNGIDEYARCRNDLLATARRLRGVPSQQRNARETAKFLSE